MSWTLPTNAGESMVVVLALLLGFALPVTAVEILWVNLITGITLGLALAFEPTEPGTMARPPRRRDAPIMSGELVWHVVLVASRFLASVFGVFTYALDPYNLISRTENVWWRSAINLLLARPPSLSARAAPPDA